MVSQVADIPSMMQEKKERYSYATYAAQAGTNVLGQYLFEFLKHGTNSRKLSETIVGLVYLWLEYRASIYLWIAASSCLLSTFSSITMPDCMLTSE